MMIYRISVTSEEPYKPDAEVLYRVQEALIKSPHNHDWDTVATFTQKGQALSLMEFLEFLRDR